MKLNNNISDKSIDIHKIQSKENQVQTIEPDITEQLNSPNNPNFYKNYAGVNNVKFKGSKAVETFISDVQNTEAEKDVNLDDSHNRVKSYKKDDREYFLTDDGTLYQVRYSKNSDKNAETVLASKLYNLAGVKTPKMRTLESHGMTGYISEYSPDLKSLETNPSALYNSFAADAWLGNWNTFNHGNTGINDSGEPVKVVTSGSLNYRASGKKKDKFDGMVDELSTLRDKNTNPVGENLLKDMSEEDLKESLRRVTQIKNNDIILAVQQSQVADKQKISDTLIARKNYLKAELEKLESKNNLKPEPELDDDNKDNSTTIEEVEPQEDYAIRKRKSEQMDKYLAGDYISPNGGSFYSDSQKQYIEKVHKNIANDSQRRKYLEDILDISFYEYKGKRDLAYTDELANFCSYPTDRLKTIAKLAAVQKPGYSTPINKSYDYHDLDDIPTDKFNYMVNNRGLKRIEDILKMNKSSFDTIKTGETISKKYGVEGDVVDNIIKFVSDESGNIPDYKRNALETMLQKDDAFKKPYGSYYQNGPRCLASSVLELCTSKEKTDFIMNKVFSDYDNMGIPYDQDSSTDIKELANSDDYELAKDKIDFFRHNLKELHSEYEHELPRVKNREQLNIYKDLAASKISPYRISSVMWWCQTPIKEEEIKNENRKPTYQYDALDFAKRISKAGCDGKLFDDLVTGYAFGGRDKDKKEMLDTFQKIQERDLLNFEMTDRYPLYTTAYCPSYDKSRKLNRDEILFLKELPIEKVEKIKKMADIPERGNGNQFRIDELADIVNLDKETQDRIEKYKLLPTTFTSDDVITLGSMSDEELDHMKNRGILQSLQLYSGYNDDISQSESIIKLDNLSDKQWDVVKKRNLMNKQVNLDSLNGSRNLSVDELLILAKQNDKDYEHTNKLLETYKPKYVFMSLDFKDYNYAKNLTELSSQDKHELLEKTMKYNCNLFDSELRTIPNLPTLLPKNKDEYCALVSGLVQSIGLNYKPISTDTKEKYYESLKNLENIHGEFLHTDFTKDGAKIDLAYPREKFIEDVEKKLALCSATERAMVTNHFGFELKKNDEGAINMSGYPVDNSTGEDNLDYSSKQLVRELQPLVKQFTEENKILPNKTISPDLAKDLNNVTKAFPELYPIIGKPQHQTHSYDVGIHTMNVLQNVLKDPKYMFLPENDRRSLQTATLFHDLTKVEGSIDKTHPACSAYDSYYLIKKLGLPESERLKIYHLIKNHDFLEKYTLANAKDYAYELRQGNNMKMECILTKADLKGVQRGEHFYHKYANKLNDAELVLSNMVDSIQKTAICLPQTKLPKASELKVDGDIAKDSYTTDSNGKTIKNKVIYLQPGQDLKNIGFKDNIKSDDLNVLVHGLDVDEQSVIFQALGQVDSGGLLSTSYVNYGKGNYHVFRNQGFILNVDSDDINVAYFRDFGSGCKKNLNKLKKEYLYDGYHSMYRNYMSDLVKKELNISDDEYKKLYPQIANKSMEQLDKENPKVATAMRNIINNMEEGKRSYGRQYNEVLVGRPKIQGVFYQGKNDDISSVPEFLRKYAEDNNVPIIYFGE